MEIQTIITFDLNELTRIRPTDRYYVSQGSRVTFQLRYDRAGLNDIFIRMQVDRRRGQFIRAFIQFDRAAPFPAFDQTYYSSDSLPPFVIDEPEETIIASDVVEAEGDYKFTIGINASNGSRYDVDPVLVVR
jgi:hypothetical protein